MLIRGGQVGFVRLVVLCWVRLVGSGSVCYACQVISGQVWLGLATTLH